MIQYSQKARQGCPSSPTEPGERPKDSQMSMFSTSQICLDQAIIALTSSISALRDRLELVLEPEYPKDTGPHTNVSGIACQPAGSELTRWLGDKTCNVNHLNLIVNELLDRLTI